MWMYIGFVFELIMLTLVFTVMNLLYWIMPSVYCRIAHKVGKSSRMAMIMKCPEDYSDQLVTWAAYKVIVRSMRTKLKKRVHKGYPAVDSPVIALDSGEKRGLLEFADHRERPFVVCFGSVTCPIFISHIRDFNDLVSRRRDDVDFLLVYIREGHADDEWRFRNARHVIPRHVTLAQRLEASRALRDCYHVTCPIAVDCMDNVTTAAYGADPMRLYVIEDNIVKYEGGPGPFAFSVKEVDEWLNTRLKKIYS